MPERRARLALAALALLPCGAARAQGTDAPRAARPAAAQAPRSVRATAARPGHWVELRGTLAPAQDGAPPRFSVESARLLAPQKYEELIGTLSAGADGGLALLGLPIATDERTEFGDLPRSGLAGRRVKVTGRFRGDHFEARELDARGAGRERIVARIDALEARGAELRWELLHVDASVPAALELELEQPLERIARDEPRPRNLARATDDDDDLGAGHALGAGWRLAAQLGLESTWREDHDLDAARERDRQDQDASARVRLDYQGWRAPTGEGLRAVVEGRWSGRFRSEEGSSDEWHGRVELGETYVDWERMFGSRISLRAGRQDFDDPREWIYDQNLDALRLRYEGTDLRVELSASTSLALDDSTSPRDEDTVNWIGYLSNADPKRHLALWCVDRRDQSDAEDSPIWFGARALGEWLPRNESWCELSIRRGYRDLTDLRGYAFDLGTTWSPRALRPLSLTAAYAFGSGDSDPLDGADDAFTQTGFNDNTDKFDGVTSFSYYGELVDPELSNLAIATLGAGLALPERQSLDLVWHGYRQDVATALDSFGRIRASTNGASPDLGWELDLVYGCRAWRHADMEFVAGWFDPGAAFDDQDPAWLLRAQFRWRP